MNGILTDIEVAAGQVVKLVHPITGAVVKIFQAGEKIVESEWHIAEGWFEQNAASAVKITKHVPVVTFGNG